MLCVCETKKRKADEVDDCCLQTRLKMLQFVKTQKKKNLMKKKIIAV